MFKLVHDSLEHGDGHQGIFSILIYHLRRPRRKLLKMSCSLKRNSSWSVQTLTVGQSYPSKTRICCANRWVASEEQPRPKSPDTRNSVQSVPLWPDHPNCGLKDFPLDASPCFASSSSIGCTLGIYSLDPIQFGQFVCLWVHSKL